MLHRATGVRGLAIRATDGDIGAVKDLYFDDARWAIRYLVADTGGWLGGREVLISPHSIVHGEWSEEAVRVSLTRAQVEGSPDVETAQPVSRHYEIAHAAYYGYPYYWTGPYLWGVGPYPMLGSARFPAYGGEAREAREMQAETNLEAREAASPAAAESHLRSCKEVAGYKIEARDGAIGNLEDLLIDDETWGIPYLVVDKRAWLPGGQVLVPPDAVEEIEWTTSTVRLTMTRDEVKLSPAYDG